MLHPFIVYAVLTHGPLYNEGRVLAYFSLLQKILVLSYFFGDEHFIEHYYITVSEWSGRIFFDIGEKRFVHCAAAVMFTKVLIMIKC